MMRDNIEFVDRDYSVVSKDKKLSSNQIKTRQASFNNIKNAWTEFRLSILNKKLDRLKNEIVTRKFAADDDNRITERSAQKLLSKTTAIARLEEKIMILSRENVPADYVNNRAIKLRKKMMDNLTFNSGNAYAVGLDKMDEIFAEEENEQINSVVSEIENENDQINSDVSEIENENDQINSDVSEIENENEQVNSAVSEETDTPLFDVVQSDENSNADIEEVQESQIGSNVPIVSPEVVEAVVNGIKDSDEDSLGANDLSEIVDSKLNEIPIAEEAIDSPSCDEESVETIPSVSSNDETLGVEDIVSAIEGAVQEVDPYSMFSYNPGMSATADNVVHTYNDENSSIDSVSDEDIRNDLETTINEFDSMPSDTISSDEDNIEISSNAIRDEIERALEKLRVSQSNSTYVNFDKFNSDGTYKTSNDDIVSSDIDEVSQEDYDITNEHKNEFIPGTDIFKPRDRGVYESDEEYVDFLREYYEAVFGNTVQNTKRRFEYKPMTQEEIMKARENIEYNKYAKIYADEWKRIKEQQNGSPVFDVPSFKNIFHPADQTEKVELPKSKVSKVVDEKPVREFPLVVPERMLPTVIQKSDVVEEIPEFVEEEGFTFDYSDATASDVMRALDSEKSVAGFKALSERAKELQEKKKRQLQRQQAVQSEALRIEGQAKKVKLDGKRAQEIYNEKMKRFEEYTRMLEEQCSDIETETEVVSKSAESNMRYIQEQEEKNRSIEELSSQIDAIISEDVTVHKGRR